MSLEQKHRPPTHSKTSPQGAIFLLLPAFLLLGIMVAPFVAQANIFSGIFRMFSGNTGGGEETGDANAAISMPLLGSKVMVSPALGVGGGIDGSEEPALSSTLDSALIAVRNPLGTLPASTQDEILVYTVVPGDTPGVIADRFGITLNTLLWANNLQNPNLIKAGDELIILPVSGVKYEVKKGDTIESIAKRFKGDVADIRSFNGLGIDEPLAVGDTLIIPDGEVIASTPSSGIGIRPRSLPEFRGYYLRPIFGGRKSRGIHGYNGVDLADSCGLPVLAAAGGTIIIARSSGWNGGYGRYVVMSHPNGTQTLYAHLLNILGTVGQNVSQGSQIATIGSTGNSTGCHVHFEVRGGKNPF